MRFKALIFDFDGVIVNSEQRRLETYKTLFKSFFNKQIEFEKKNLIGKPEKDNLIYLLEKYNINEFKFDELINIRKELLIKEAKKGFEFFNLTLDLINFLNKKSVPYLICSNSDKDYIINAIEKNKLISPVDIITPNKEIKPKPYPDMFFKALDLMDLSKKEVLIIEDSPVWINVSNEYGFKTAAFLSNFNENELNGAVFYIKPDSLNDLKVIQRQIEV